MSDKMRIAFLRTLFITGFLLLGGIFFNYSLSFALMAGDGQRLHIIPGQQGNITYALGVSTTFLNGEGKEYVYDPELDDMKISDLRWESANVWLLGGHISMQYSEWLTVNAGYWKKTSSATGTMTDDDWNSIEGLRESDDPRYQTNFSESKSDLTEGSAYDINGSISVMKFRQDSVHVRAIAGYQKTEWEWEASDGYWIYIEELLEPLDNGIVGIGTAGNFDGVGIRYKQETIIPYVGVSIDYRGQPVGIQAHALYSNRVEIEATDDHLERNLRAEDSLEEGEYWSFGVQAKWTLSPKLAVVGGVEYEKIQTIKGDSKLILYDEDHESTIDDGAGAGYHSTAFTFSMIYSF